MVHASPMLSRVRDHLRGAKFARMSSGTYCIVRDLGLVKGGKGMRHHEVLVAFGPRAFHGWVVTAGRDLASAVKRRWLSFNASWSVSERMSNHHRAESTSQPLPFARSPVASSVRRAGSTDVAPPATPIADSAIDIATRRHVAGDAEQDYAGEQVGGRTRGPEPHPVASPSRPARISQTTDRISATVGSAHAGENVGAGGGQRDLEDHREPRHLQRPRHLVEPGLDREPGDRRQHDHQIAPKAITNSAIASVNPSMAIIYFI